MLSAARHCLGCVDDFYNGKNDLGVKVCWNLETAQLVPTVLIHIDALPPYRNIKPKDRPNCYKQAGYVSVKPEQIGADGYWKHA